MRWGSEGGPERPDQWTGDDSGPRSGARARARGRFTRNFVIQATAAEWALALLATLRTALAGTEAPIVFFQHDEVIVHAPAGSADDRGRRGP